MIAPDINANPAGVAGSMSEKALTQLHKLQVSDIIMESFYVEAEKQEKKRRGRVD
jgi:hypothetical protein